MKETIIFLNTILSIFMYTYGLILSIKLFYEVIEDRKKLGNKFYILFFALSLLGIVIGGFSSSYLIFYLIGI